MPKSTSLPNANDISVRTLTTLSEMAEANMATIKEQTNNTFEALTSLAKLEPTEQASKMASEMQSLTQKNMELMTSLFQQQQKIAQKTFS